MVTGFYGRRCFSSWKGPPYTTCNPNDNVVSQGRRWGVWFFLDYAYGKLAKNSCPSSQSHSILVRIHARQDDSVRMRSCSSFCGWLLLLAERVLLKTSVRDSIASWWRAGRVMSKSIVSSSQVGSKSSASGSCFQGLITTYFSEMVPKCLMFNDVL